MTRDDMKDWVKQLCPEIASWQVDSIVEQVDLAVAAEREKVAAWMISKGYSTGHGDTTEDLLKELEWQIRERAELEKDAAWIYWFVDIRKASEQVLGVLEYLDKIDTERLYGLDEVIDGFYKTLNTRMPKRSQE